MASRFIVQIVEAASGVIVEWAPGRRVERNLIEDLCERVAAKGVGVGRTTAHVLDDIRTSMEELLYELKTDVSPR